MKQVGIVTLNDYVNFGNRLQNYALVEYVNKFDNCTAMNIWNKSLEYIIKDLIKSILPQSKFRRISKFRKFNTIIKTKKNASGFDYYITGSDQVWNPNWAANDELLLKNVEKGHKISYSASFGVKNLTENQKNKFKNELKTFKAISVREETGKEIINKLDINKKVSVLIDPTMLLTAEEWEKVIKQPKNSPKKKFILNYFLGEMSQSRKKEIENIAKENDCIIINIMDPKDKYYISGPGEFLWFEKNAFLICTDSFHSSVFAMLFNRPFVVFNREEKNKEDMSTRIDNLLTMFELTNRKYNGTSIINENLNHNYKKAYEILEKERKKSKNFLEEALELI